MTNALKIEITFGEFIEYREPKEIKDGKLKYEIFPIKEVISQLETQYLRNPHRLAIEIGDKYRVKFKLKLLTFLKKGCFCYRCNLKGQYFAIEKDILNGSSQYYQLNMYNGDVLFTHDHIKARAFGGANDISNTCTMCINCNRKKGEFESLYLNYSKAICNYEIALSKLRDKFSTQILDSTSSDICSMIL